MIGSPVWKLLVLIKSEQIHLNSELFVSGYQQTSFLFNLLDELEGGWLWTDFGLNLYGILKPVFTPMNLKLLVSRMRVGRLLCMLCGV